MAKLECYVCGKKFRTRDKYVVHIFTEDHIATEIRETTCQICGFKSSKVSELADHLGEPCRPAWLEDFLNSSFIQNHPANNMSLKK